MRHWNVNSSRRLISVVRDSVEPVRDDRPASRDSSGKVWPNTKHGLHTNVERQPQRRRNYWLGAFEVADGCAQLADEFRTSRPCDMIQYGIDLVGCVAKVLAP